MLTIQVLGELELERDGEPVQPPQGGPARRLLAWLALHPGQHARSLVAGRLWPDVLEESARGSLRTSLLTLRAAIGDGELVADRATLGLGGAVHVDAREFERLRALGRDEEALALCRGELLTGMDEDWVLVARDEHRDVRADMLGRLCEAASADGRREAALGFARRRAALDPLDEASHRELLTKLEQAGDRAGALAAHEKFADRLRRQLGVAPSAVTRELVRGLREDPGESPPTSRPRRDGRSPRLLAFRRPGGIVGRDAELTCLRRTWDDTAGGPCAVVMVTGEPGIGKTRLACEFAGGLDGAVVLYGSTDPDGLVPYGAVTECLREASDLVPAWPNGSGALAPLLAGPAEGPGPGSAAGSPAARLRFFEAAASLLEAVAARGPLVLVLDDLHWADRPAAHLLAHLARHPRGAPRMIVATYRDTEVHAGHPLLAVTAELRRSSTVTRVELHGLPVAAVASMAASPDLAEARMLRDRTGGNPLYVEQLVHGGSDGTGGVAELIRARVDALGPLTRALLEAAAVAGPQFELPLVAEAIGIELDVALDLHDAATRARLVGEAPGDPGRCAFLHAVVRETLSGSLTAARRTYLHEALATVLEDRAGDDPDRYLAALATHALDAAAGGGDAARAADVAERAAARAGAALAHEDAARLLRRAFTTLERRGAPAARRGELACAAGEALARAGLIDEARETFATTRALALTADRPDLLARAALAAQGAGVTILGTDPGRVAELERAHVALGDGSSGLRARLLARLAIELAYDPDRARVEEASERALALARDADEPAALAAALGARHVTLWGPDHTEHRLAIATEMVALAQRAQDAELALQARGWRVANLLEAGDGPALRDEIDAYAVLSADACLPAYAWYVPMWRATLAFLDGRVEEGLDLSRRAREQGRLAQDANADICFAEQGLLRVLVEDRLGEPGLVEAGMSEAVAERAERGPAWRAYRLTFAWMYAAQGDLTAARRQYDAALAEGVEALPRDVNWLAAMSAGSGACVLLGDRERAPAMRALLEPYAHRMLVTSRGASCGGSVAYAVGRLAWACGDHDGAEARFVEAAERDERLGARVWVRRDLEALRRCRDGLSVHDLRAGDRADQRRRVDAHDPVG